MNVSARPMPRRSTCVLTACLLVAGLAAAQGPSRSRSAQPPVSVYPTAGTTTADPASQISFRGVRKRDLHGIEVVGTHSGSHTGHLHAHSDHHGASYVLSKPLAPAETVSVRADKPLIGAGADGAVTF